MGDMGGLEAGFRALQTKAKPRYTEMKRVNPHDRELRARDVETTIGIDH